MDRTAGGPSSRAQPFLTYPRERALGYFDLKPFRRQQPQSDTD